MALCRSDGVALTLHSIVRMEWVTARTLMHTMVTELKNGTMIIQTMGSDGLLET